MSEIEKLYENAEVKKQYDYTVIKKNYNGKIGYTKRAVLEKVEQFKNKTLRIIEVCPFYPDFTAEKQLELIKWLTQKYKTILIEHKLNLFYINIRDIYTGMVHIEFDETIAGLINNLWQDLTESERKQIADILRG